MVTRPLVPVTLALMAGLIAAAWGLTPPGKLLAPLLLLLWAATALLCWRQRPVFLLPLALFFLLGTAFYQQALHPVVPATHLMHLPQEQDLVLKGHLYRPGKLGGAQVQLFVEAEAWQSPGGWTPASGKLLVKVPLTEPPPVGTPVVVKGRIRRPHDLKNPGTFNRTRYLAADGIFWEMSLRDPRNLAFLASTKGYPLGEKLRGGIRQLLRSLNPVCRAMYLAMLLGDQGEITQQMRQNFARTGTSHLLVINGLHLGMVAAVTYFLVFWLLRRFPWLLLRLNVVKTATLLAALPVVGYAWVAGGSPSTQRAEIMVLAFLLLVFLGRPGEVWSALALAALVILSLAPLRLFTISFQLSFVAVAALIYLVPRLVRHPAGSEDKPPGLFGRLWFRAREWLAVSVVAALATAPLVAYYFQIVSLLGVLVNLVAIPLVLLLALPLGEAAVLAQAVSATPGAQALLAVGKIPLWLGYQVIKWGAQIPGGAIIVPVPTWLEIIAYYLVLILVFSPRRNNLTWAGAGLAAAVLVGAAALPLTASSGRLEVTCLDSFGGLHGVIVSPEGQRLAVTAAPKAWPGKPGQGMGPLPAYCHWRQFRHLEMVAALSLSQDNAGELLSLARQFAVGQFWYGRRGREGESYWDLYNFLGEKGAVPKSLMRGRPPEELGSVTLKFLELEEKAGVALHLSCQGRQVLILPPGSDLRLTAVPAGPTDLLVLPATAIAGQERAPLLARQPRQLVIYGSLRRGQAAHNPLPGVPCHFTAAGAVSAYLSADGVVVRQWQP